MIQLPCQREKDDFFRQNGSFRIKYQDIMALSAMQVIVNQLHDLLLIILDLFTKVLVIV